jgi:hypothetical protein
MKISPPSIPIHLARVYGVQSKPVVQPVNPLTRRDVVGLDLTGRPDDSIRLTDQAKSIQSIRPTENARTERLEALVAAQVPGGIRFTEDGPEPTSNPTDLRTADAIRAAVEGRAQPTTTEQDPATAIPMYRNPAMRNAAAATIAYSRTSLDING